MSHAEAVIDLAAITQNVATLTSRTAAEVMAVVKADGYGHGLLDSAQAAMAGGATWLGVATLDEALRLRAADVTVPVFSWLWSPSETDEVDAAVADQIDLSVSSLWQLTAVREAAEDAATTARVHLKIDTGLSRNGAYVTEWPELLAAAAKAQAAGEIDVVGIWSHLACADEPGSPVTDRQLAAFEEALTVAAREGITPRYRHVANSAAALAIPAAHYDLVRPGIAIYGLSPLAETYGLRPAMTLRAEIANVKRVRAGEGVSYSHLYTTLRETTLALVPLGYADGIPRNATNVGPVSINGSRFTVAGRVCMDQFVVDVGDLPVAAGDTAVLFGTGEDGTPTAHDWAEAVGTIHYEIVTRLGARIPRTYV
ncbi:MAG TPA: alanine racemase [Jatrophihabitans sp.]|jgi:alanine racemase